MHTIRRTAVRSGILGATLLMAAGLAAPSASAEAGYLAACTSQVGTRQAYNGWPVPAVDLARGSRGDCVRALQLALIRTNFVDSADVMTFIDGDFGPKTEAAVLRFQSRYPRETGGPDGIVGIKTWGYLLPAAEG
ncbi:peptidoglycan-binding protein [Streptomyces venezuelae]|uniref:peptidoglycan-binding domain-containing protein n=1 Tax=Streptomyces venezuelae TaxID=54571 RepID=UPI001239DF18|nr:peptidoglycan-binding protein [Streptomyces venezuelae]QES04732.1 peptidoglycan-binding protein [Streptomyces venezuelae]